jgi:hypothetical protein
MHIYPIASSPFILNNQVKNAIKPYLTKSETNSKKEIWPHLFQYIKLFKAHISKRKQLRNQKKKNIKAKVKRKEAANLSFFNPKI